MNWFSVVSVSDMHTWHTGIYSVEILHQSVSVVRSVCTSRCVLLYIHFHFHLVCGQPRWLSGLRRSRIHSPWLLVDHCVLRNWDRILVRAVKGLISRAGMVLICPLLWQRDVKLQQTTNKHLVRVLHTSPFGLPTLPQCIKLAYLHIPVLVFQGLFNDIRLGHTYTTHRYLLAGEDPPVCILCQKFDSGTHPDPLCRVFSCPVPMFWCQQLGRTVSYSFSQYNYTFYSKGWSLIFDLVK